MKGCEGEEPPAVAVCEGGGHARMPGPRQGRGRSREEGCVPVSAEATSS